MALKESTVYELSRSKTTAKINLLNTQLFSLKREGLEVMWKGGAPIEHRPIVGWQNSEIVMFPIIGATPNGKITVDGTNFPMSQHGLARNLPWQTNINSEGVSMAQIYEAGNEVKNSKGEISVFPRSYKLTKNYSIDGEGKLVFKIEIENRSREALPYSIGWHPAFLALENSTVRLSKDGTVLCSFSLQNVFASPGNVIVADSCDNILYKNDRFNVEIKHDFGTAQVWNKSEGYVALEPISSKSLSRYPNEPEDLMLNVSMKKLMRGENHIYTAQIGVLIL